MTDLYVVDYLAVAVRDFHAIASRPECSAILNVVDKPEHLGPKLVPPHMKSLKGHADVFELRPRAGRSAFRPIYVRIGDSFRILAIPNKSDFDAAIERAARTAAQLRG